MHPFMIRPATQFTRAQKNRQTKKLRHPLKQNFPWNFTLPNFLSLPFRPPLPAAMMISLMTTVALSGCSPTKELEASRAAYAAACHGTPLRTLEARNKASEDGYNINREFDCIDKASYVAVTDASAKWQAANTPEAIALREAVRAKEIADAQALRTAAAERERVEARPPDVPPVIVLRAVDVNTATESELANVISVGPTVAARVVAERQKRRFSGWPDLVNRVVGLSQAQSAVYASVCGLTVDGNSLDGAPPDAVVAALISKRYQRSER
jgi:DNA uptake protein ComE-like DNA-binding protein